MIDIFRQNRQKISGEQSSLLNQSKIRLIAAASIFFLGYFAIGLRLADLTLLKERPAEENAVHAAAVHAVRSEILDRNGDVMATSLAMTSVYADATLVSDPEQLARKLAQTLPDQSKSSLAEKLSSEKKFVWIARNITPKQAYAVNALGEPALEFRQENRRVYPAGNLAAHIVGYTDIDDNGISGAEKGFNSLLAAGKEPVRLTIDMRLQHILHRELSAAVKKFKAKAGIGAIMDVNSGEILAMVSLPDFDPHRPGEATDNTRFNRSTLGVFEMGSTFKLFSTAAALDSGTVRFNSVFDATEPIRYGRFTIADFHPEKRPLTVPEMFIHSSNIGTAKMAASLAPNTIKDFYKALGFFEPAPLPLPEKGMTLYPRPWRELDTMTTAYGHGIAVSPVHLLRAGAAVVNGGTLVTPEIILSKTAPLLPKGKGPRVISPETSTKMRQLLELTVAAGTGGNAKVDGYRVGGKTGTAEKINARGGYNTQALLSSFLGFFPIDKPRYEILAILDEPKAASDTYGYATGGWTAAPVVAKVIEQMGPLYHILPEDDRASTIVRDMSPYLKGKNIAAARSDR